MSRRHAGIVLEQVQRVLDARAGEQLADRELLRRFAAAKDEQAFAVLVKRHGAMVLNVCRRALHNEHDAEDAFQAAFLVLARHASARLWHDSVGPWLYRVAYRLALRLKAGVERHAKAQRTSEKAAPADPLAIASGRELCAALDEELSRLPERLRAPLLLCCLESCTRDEAAQRLGLSLSVVKHRLEDGRALLRQRLLRRGFPLAAVLGAGLWIEQLANAALPARLVQSIVGAAGQLASGHLAAVSVPARALALMKGFSKSASPGQFKALLVLVVSICLAGTAGPLALRQTKYAEPAQEKVAAENAPPGKTTVHEAVVPPPAGFDAHGDPLPDDAIARLGTLRFRDADGVSDLAFTPDSKFLYSAGTNGARVWDPTTGQQLRRIPDKRIGPGAQACISHAAGRIAIGGGHGPLGGVVIEIASGKAICYFGKANNISYPASFAPDGKSLAVTYIDDDTIDVIDVDSRGKGRLLHRLQSRVNRRNYVLSQPVVFAPDGKSLICSGPNGTIEFVDLATQKSIRSLPGNPGGIACLALSPNGRQLVFSRTINLRLPGGQRCNFVDNHPHLLDLQTGKELRRIIIPTTKTTWKEDGRALGPHVLTFSPDGKTLLTGGLRGEVQLFDLATGKEIRRLADQGSSVSALAYSPDGKTIAIADAGKCIRVCDAATGHDLVKPAGHHDEILAVAAAPDGRRIITVGKDGAIYTWDGITGREVLRLTAGPNIPKGVAYAADAQVLGCISSDDLLHFWNLESGRELFLPRACKTSRPRLTVSPNGKRMTYIDAAKIVHVLDGPTGTELLRLSGPEREIMAFAFAPDSQTLLAWSQDQNLYLWDTTTGKRQQRPCPGPCMEVSFSPDGRYLAMADSENRIFIVDAANGKEVRHITRQRPDSNGDIWGLAFSPDGKSLAWSSPGDSTIFMGEVASGKLRHRFVGHRCGIMSLAFTDDGKKLVSGSDDTTALVWDLSGRSRVNAERRFTASEMDSLWADLAADDAVCAYAAIRALAAAAAQSVPYLQQHLSPAAPVDTRRIVQLILDLDDKQFVVRQNATWELEELGDSAQPAMQKALAGKTSLEVNQRLNELLNRLRDPSRDLLRALRAIEALELADTIEGRKFLTVLSRGAAEARLTRDAKEALERLKRRIFRRGE
ncbi:MAG TPA: sigma-70 family RNA polymerase sigma factor [Gemmataceae bacterium]|nr:sigma-70 family RNA polymerase sigma factor [Gemmataceae bacterium]